MVKIYLLLLFIAALINGCSSTDYSREGGQAYQPPPVVDQSQSDENIPPRTLEAYQPKVITTAAASQSQNLSRAHSYRTPASRTAVLDLLKQSKTAMDEQNYNEAESLLKRALRIEPGNAWLWHNMAVLQFYRENYQQAIQQALKSNNLAKNNKKLESDNYKVIKQSYIELGKPEKAAEYQEW